MLHQLNSETLKSLLTVTLGDRFSQWNLLDTNESYSAFYTLYTVDKRFTFLKSKTLRKMGMKKIIYLSMEESKRGEQTSMIIVAFKYTFFIKGQKMSPWKMRVKSLSLFSSAKSWLDEKILFGISCSSMFSTWYTRTKAFCVSLWRISWLANGITSTT